MYKLSVGERTRRWDGDQDHQQTDQELISHNILATEGPNFPFT